MKIPLLDLQAQYRSMKKDIDEAMARVVESQNFILSNEVEKLEEEVAAYAGVKYASGVASGTDALVLSLRAMDIGPGDSVITSPFTFMATAEAVSLVGAKPIFVDINPDTYNIDSDKIENLLRDTQCAIRDTIKAIIPVHIYGQCADMEKIKDIAQKYGLKVIEDAAQAIGAVRNGKRAGSFGDSGCLSFFPSKNLGAFGDGGMVVSDDRDFIDRVKRLRAHGSRVQYVHDEIGYNSRLDSLQAAVLRVKLKKLDAWLDGRRNITARYNEAFSGLPVKTPVTAAGNIHTYHQYTIAADKREDLLRFLTERGVAARVYYPVPLHLQACYQGLGYGKGSFPVTEEMSEKVLSLPVYPELSDEQIAYIIQTVEMFVRNE